MNHLGFLFVRKEFLGAPRRRFFYWKRLALVLLTSLFLLIAFMFGLSGGGGATGGGGFIVFRMLATFVLFAACALSALVAGQFIMREKSERTLGLLFLSDLNANEQILGRYATSLLVSFVMVLSAFPLFILTGVFGGISSLQIGAAFMVILGTITLGCAIGLFASSAATSERTMAIIAVVISLMIFGVIPVAVKQGMTLAGKDSSHLLPIISAFDAMNSIAWAKFLACAPLNLLFSLVVGFPFVALAWLNLPRGILKAEGAAKENDFWQRLVVDRLNRWFPRPPIRGNPIAWRDLHFAYNGIASEWFIGGMIVVPLIVGCSALVYMLFDTMVDLRKVIGGASGIAAIGAGGIFAIMVTYRSSRAFFGEIENRTLEILLTTPVAEKSIVNGKFKAVYESTLPWLLLAILLGVVAVLCLEVDVGVNLFFLIYAAYTGFSAYAFVCVALLLSTKHRAAMAMVMTVVYFIIWTWVVKPIAMFFLVFLVGMISMAFAMVSPELAVLVGVVLFLTFLISMDVTLAMMCMGSLRRRFRRTVLNAA